ncbi:UNVERIFIED_CONTAM: hypothetical protein FKN15_013552 [Acipenser sinensis]
MIGIIFKFPLRPVTLQSSVENVLKTLVKSCRPYFPEDATKEMLQEWRPLLCPFDVTMQKAIGYFELFLPTTLPPELHQKGFKLWFDELMGLWVSVQNLPGWEGHLVNLFARLASDNIGYLDWDPYVDKGGPSKQTQKQLSGLFNSITSFFHPSNNGRWLMKLMKLVQRLPASVVRRLHREWYKKQTWLTPVPDSHKLTDQDITDFVESMKQPVLLAMFSKTGSLDAAQALQNLALMRPELVIPPVLEKTYPAMETLTEPHQLTATLSCVIGVARSLVSGGKRFPEGPKHMLPLLMRALPGVDPNDFSKCMITFQFIATFSTLVPLVDCSSAVHERDDLTEVERELCSVSAEFEDFVLQFMDRCFALIESSTLEQTREETETEKMTHLESLVELGLSSTFSTILTQCSKDIFKVHKHTQKHMFPYSIVFFLKHKCLFFLDEDILREEELDKELLWNLQLLSEITRVDGDKLLPYREQCVKILQRTLHLKCKQGYMLSCNLLHHLLRSASLIYPTEYCSIPGGFNKPLSEYFPIKDWGAPGDLWNLNIHWHVPTSEEKAFVFYILDIILQPELVKLQRHASGELEMPRDDILQSLTIVQHCLMGSGSFLPFLDGERITDLVPSLVSLGETALYTGVDYGSAHRYHPSSDSGGAKMNTRCPPKRVPSAARFFTLCRLTVQPPQSYSVGGRRSSGQLTGKPTGTRQAYRGRWCVLHGRKQHIRALLIDRVMLQQELRKLTVEGCEYKTIHRDLLRDLLRLSTSTYSQVRSKAQQVFFVTLGSYNFCCRDLIPLVLEYLKPDRQDISQQQFKGALYCLLGNHNGVCLANLHDWDCIVQTWPAIISSGLSKAMSLEKPSIVRLFDDLADKIHRQYETIGLDFSVPGGCLEIALQIMKSKNPTTNLPLPTSEEIEKGVQLQQAKNIDSVQKYERLVNSLLDSLNQRNLPWKFEHIAIGFLSLLLRDDKPIPVPAIRFFVQSLNHDALVVRKGLFRNFDNAFLPVLRPHLERLVADSHESTQRCVAEIVAGLIRGCKHWTFEKVREMAATTLSGLLQCNFLTMDAPMQTHFEKLCKTRLPKKRKRDPGSVVDTIPPADLVKRHAGVLGLSACILSNPYDVPTWMPQLLMDLSAHLNDTQPIEELMKQNGAENSTGVLEANLFW